MFYFSKNILEELKLLHDTLESLVWSSVRPRLDPGDRLGWGAGQAWPEPEARPGPGPGLRTGLGLGRVQPWLGPDLGGLALA